MSPNEEETEVSIILNIKILLFFKGWFVYISLKMSDSVNQNLRILGFQHMPS